MTIDGFVEQIRGLGFQVRFVDGQAIFPYTVPVGRLAGQEIHLGFVIPGDFPTTPPSGPHVKPQILPLNPRSGQHPTAGIHQSDFGPEWEYWSRPFGGWAKTDKSAATYMAHIRHLFDTL